MDNFAHMQKALTQMNLKLQHVVSDIAGGTGMRMRAIVSGERNPRTLAKLWDARCRSSVAAIAAALDGWYRAEHLFELRQALESCDFLRQTQT
jgi:transposase